MVNSQLIKIVLITNAKSFLANGACRFHLDEEANLVLSLQKASFRFRKTSYPNPLQSLKAEETFIHIFLE